MHHSVWSDTAKMPSFSALKEDKKTDVLIIGGGICGILCAYFLDKAGVDYILVEGKKIASGITKNTTAKITSQHGLIYADLIKHAGEEKARQYLEANEAALRQYEALCHNLDCNFEKKNAFTYSLESRAKIEAEVEAAHRLGFEAKFIEKIPLPLSVKGAICFENQAQFHPLQFLAAIAKDLHIYENTFIRDLTPSSALADGAKIQFKKAIIATHFPFLNKHGGYFLKLYQHRSYVTAYENAGEVDGMYVDEADSGLSFRSFDGLLLLGGSGHRTGKKTGAWQALDAFAKKHYPKSKIKYQWATQDCMTLDGVPYIGKYAKHADNLFVATGFQKWGMTSSMVAATLLCDMVQDKQNDLAPLFSPQRSMLKPQLFINSVESAVNLLKPKAPRCPHLGCTLSWNRAEHTWDCPCHGSRFEKDGTLIDNPATGNANIQ